jgi:hypothetical protein
MELYGLDGTLLQKSNVTFSSPPVNLFLAQNPSDSSLTFLYGGTGGVRATFVDRLLNVHGQDVSISATRDSVRNSVGAYRNDTLFAVWEDYRNGSPAIYGTGHPVERISAGVAGTGESGSKVMAISLLPNPASSVASLELHLSHSTSVRVDLSSMDGVTLYNGDLGTLPSGFQRITLPSEQFASGMYLVRVEAGEQIWQLNLLVLH